MKLPRWLGVVFPPYAPDAAGEPGKAVPLFREAHERVSARIEAERPAGPEAAGGSPEDVIRAAAGNALAAVRGAGPEAEAVEFCECPARLAGSGRLYQCEIVQAAPHERHRDGDVEWTDPEGTRQRIADAIARDGRPESVGLAEAGSVFSGGDWLAGAQEPEPDTVPLRKPVPLPRGVLGYVVVLRGESRDTLADSDLRRSLEAAQADAGVHGKRAGWAGRAVACEVRLAGAPGTAEGAEE